ncbi:hypothetical protein L3C95_30445 [Chitinophaga filiformis]|uniref:hypothetical protein n=1 Tax=Chitinophaga filiformis TaxID=104663 RepID=UPI001F48BDD2|nr:hypothetical protein [Chitinophaga filiformis]MCF6407253.1 hypothetical protein [Chitinophaga filiformis]
MTKFTLYTFIILGLALSSCNSSNVFSISDNEDKGIKEVLEYYGGICKYAVGYSASTKEGKTKYFEVEMTKSDIIEKFANALDMPASNIAYLFYRNLKQEKDNYDEIHVVIILQNERKMIFKYPKEDLATIDRKMGVVEKVVDILKRKNFDGLKPYLNPDTTYIHYNEDTLINNVAKFDPQFGSIKEFSPYGFRFLQRERDLRKVLHISGVLLRDKQNNEFSVDVDPQSTKDEIIVLQYAL